MDGTYAPQSPDLSSFLSSPSKQQSYNTRQAAPISSYTPRSPVIPSSFGAQTVRQQNDLQMFDGGPDLGFGHHTYMPPIPPLPATHAFNTIPHETGANFTQIKSEVRGPAYPPITAETHKPVSTAIKNEGREHFPSVSSMSTSTRPPRQRKTAAPFETASSSAPSEPSIPLRNPNPNSIVIRTKFPVARIKRIMQADEEVGKVAQVSPVAVSKALELFMIALVEGAADKAKEGGGKRITAGHLKGVVEGDERWDFLGEIVGRIIDKSGETEQEEGKGKGKGKRGKASESDGSESEEVKGKKKKGRGGRRKKANDE